MPTPAESYASKADLYRVEEKVDDVAECVSTLASDVRAMNERMLAKDALEKQAQILMAEVNEARRTAAAEKEKDKEAWVALKTRALWTAMLLLTIVSMPGVAGIIRQMKGLVP